MGRKKNPEEETAHPVAGLDCDFPPVRARRLRQSIYYAKNIAGGSNTVTVTFNQAAFVDVRALEYSGFIR